MYTMEANIIQRWIQDFPGGANPKGWGGCQPIIWPKICHKLHENEEKLDRRGASNVFTM